MFKDMLQSIISPHIYSDIFAYHWRRSVSYMVILLLLTCTATTLISGPRLFAFLIAHVKQEFGGTIPQITIERGILSAKIDQPVIKRLNHFYIVIDTTDQIKDLDDTYPFGILLNSNSILWKSGANNKKIIDISGIDYFILNETQAYKWKKLVFWLLLPFLVFMSFIYKCMTVFFLFLFVGIAGLYFMKSKHIEVTLQNILNLEIYSLTPALLLSILFTLCRVDIAFGEHIVFFIYFMNACRINYFQRQ